MDGLGHTGEAVARHVSPDGKLTWRVQKDANPDCSFEYTAGFEGHLWHLHADQLERRGEPLAVLMDLTADLLEDKLVIMEVAWLPDERADATGVEYWLLGDLEIDIQAKPNDEVWKLRFWSGRDVNIDDLIDGRVKFVPLDLRGPVP